MGYWTQFILVTVAMIIADVCWTYYFIKVEERKVLASGIWSTLIVLSGSYITTSYVENRSLIPAALIGAFIGAAGSVWYKKRKEEGK